MSSIETNQPPERDLLERIEAARVPSGLSKSNFGRHAVNDPAFVFDLERGREIRSKTRASVISFIDGLAEKAAS